MTPRGEGLHGLRGSTRPCPAELRPRGLPFGGYGNSGSSHGRDGILGPAGCCACRSREDGKTVPRAQAEPAPALSHPWSSEMRSSKGRVCRRPASAARSPQPGTEQTQLLPTPTALPLPQTVPRASTAGQTAAPVPEPRTGSRPQATGMGTRLLRPGTASLQAPAHPTPACAVSPRGGRDHGGGGGGRGPAARPCQAPAASCSCHITILPRACPNNRGDCGGRKPEGHGAASGTGLAGDPHAAPRCPARCLPHGTLGCPNPRPRSAITPRPKPPSSAAVPPQATERGAEPLGDAHGASAAPAHGPRRIDPSPAPCPDHAVPLLPPTPGLNAVLPAPVCP